MGKIVNAETAGIPKKVNRHVMKALNLLAEGNIQQWISVNTIIDQVQYQMRNLAPISDPISTIMRSLETLSLIGIIKKKDNDLFAIGHRYAKQLATNNSNKSIPPFSLVLSKKPNENDVSIPNCIII